MDENQQPIKMDTEDQRDGLRIWRRYQESHDLMHAAENDWNRWCGQMQLLYAVPAGFQMTDIMRGFEPAPGVENG